MATPSSSPSVPAVVAHGRALRDLSPFLRRLQRRRDRRPGRASSPTSTTWPGWVSTGSGCRRSARRPTPTGATTWPTTAASIPPTDHSRRSTPWWPRPAGGGSEILLDLVPNHTSEQHPVVRRRPVVAGGRAPRLVRMGRPGPRRWSAQQLDGPVRGPGLDTRRGFGPVLPAQLHPRAAGPQLVEPGGAPRLRGHHPLLVGPRGGRVPHRRLQHDDQGRRTPGQPAGHRRGLADGADLRSTLRLQRQPARGARHPPWLAAAGRQLRPAPGPPRGDRRAPARRCCPPSTATAPTNCTWLSTCPGCTPTFQADALRAVVEETERILPAGAWPVWTGSNLDTSRLATRWAEGDPGTIRCILLALLTLRGMPVIYQGDEIGLPDAVLTEEALRDPVGRRYWPACHRARPGAVASPLGRRARARLHHPRRPRPGFPWAPRRSATWPPSATIRVRCSPSPATSSPSVEPTPICTAVTYRSQPSPPDTWLWTTGGRVRHRLNLGSDTATLEGVDRDGGHRHRPESRR